MSRKPLPYAICVLCALLSACKGEERAPAKPPRLTVEELKKPETCMDCHPTHYREWKASMHAYASDDPVFLAMNALGQEETNGEMGDFCVNCHAPMALREGFVDGGVLAEDTPQHMKGVTCYFCHNVESVTGDHNAEVKLANDDVMRGGIIDPVEPSAHGVRFSRFMDRYNPESSKFCGGCHDIVNDNGVHLERTFAEYNESIFAQHGTRKFQTCSGCHMPNRQGLAAVDDGLPGEDEQVATRTVHSHLWPGVDVPLTEWPDREAYEEAVACELDVKSINVLINQGQTGADESGGVRYVIETGAGHNMPSGASQDRRMWVEMIAYDANGEIVCSVGRVPDDVAVTEYVSEDIICPMGQGGPSANDPIKFPLFRDRIFDEDGNETHNFWDAAPSDELESGFVSRLLRPALMVLEDGSIADHTTTLQFGPLVGLPIDYITVRLKIRPIDFDVLRELVDAGHLDEDVLSEVRTFTIDGASVDYHDEGGRFVATKAAERTTSCYDAQFCAFDPDAPGCD